MCYQLEAFEMNQLYLDLVSVKLSCDNIDLQSQNVFTILKQYIKYEIVNFDYYIFQNIFSKEFTYKLYNLFLHFPTTNLCIYSIFFSYYDIYPEKKEVMLNKLFTELKNEKDHNIIVKLLQLMSSKYQSLLLNLCEKGLLKVLTEIHVDDKELIEKSIFISMQNHKFITTEVIESLFAFTSNSGAISEIEKSEFFLRLISSASIKSELNLDIASLEILWNAIFTNLVSSQPINRKRAMYWINRLFNSLFHYNIKKLSLQLQNENFTLILKQEIVSEILILIDALEEKQTHIITPTLPKFNNLKLLFVEKSISIHWLLIIIEKAMLHESTIILKWALKEFINLPVYLTYSTYYELLLKVFITLLNNSNLYFSPESVSDTNGFFASDSLTLFLNGLFKEFSKNENEQKFHKFLDLISLVSWNSQALLFFAESFSKINSINFSFHFLSKISYLCSSNLPTFDVKYRQCISTFFLTGFFNNHSIDNSCILDYLKVFHTTFDINKCILTDSDLFELLSNKFQSSLSSDGFQDNFNRILDLFHSMNVSDSDFKIFSNKISCFTLFFSFYFNTVPEILVCGFFDYLSKSIRDSLYNPYANFNRVFKSIMCLKQFHLNVSSKIDSCLSTNLALTITESLTYIMSSLSFFIKNNNDQETRRNCIELMRYFVNRFPKSMVKIYNNELAEESPLKIVISANIDLGTKINRLKTFDLGFLEKIKLLGPLEYEKINLLSKNIEFLIEKYDAGKLISFYSDLLDACASVEYLIVTLNLIGSSLNNFLLESTFDTSICVIKLLRSTWNSVVEFLSNAQKFWKVYLVFVEKIFLNLLATVYRIEDEEKSEEIINFLNYIIELIFEIGENKFGMVYLLGDNLHNFLIDNQYSIENKLSDFYLNLISKLILFGPCHRRSLRFENKIDRYLSHRYRNRWQSKIVNKLAESSDRVSGILILSIANERILTGKFLEKMISKLSEIDKELLMNSKSCYKNYINNRLHRTRHRIFSTLLICLKMSTDNISQETIDFIEKWMLVSIEKETLNSIRHFAEWIIILIYYQNESRIEKLINYLRSITDSKPAYICSLISIARHLVELLPARMNVNDIIEQLILAILPLGSAQNYNVRLHSMCFINTLQTIGIIPATKPYLTTVISSCISFVNRSTTGKNIYKLQENFWWSKFSPLEDVSLETVFYILPKLFDLVEEELITLDQFTHVSKSIEMYRIHFDNRRSLWKECKDSVWRVKTENFNDDKSHSNKGHESTIVDVQKKIQPWLTSRPDEEYLRVICGETLPASDIVLVCSLLDKPTNIGGLARTSNIFGVGEFVVENLRIVDDNNFKQLAVTADKWINMSEVPTNSLVDFISVKRMEGFEIVGVEQTANSVHLQSAIFARKTVLILGNEKEGIPADLISHLDRCIEIPQIGQIRSLNVHVTGAIVLWEYMKQIKLSTKSK